MSNEYHDEEVHIVPPSVYIKVLGGLMVLMALTVAVSYHHFGDLGNLLIALAISFCKMILIVLFFMHIKYSSRLTWVVAACGLFWFMIMITLTFCDYLSRDWISPFTANPYLG